jgi:hypothetical protein
VSFSGLAEPKRTEFFKWGVGGSVATMAPAPVQRGAFWKMWTFRKLPTS